MSTNKCRFKWLMMAAVIFGGLTVAPRASATCVNDVDCPNPVCGGQVCDYNPQPPTCKAADPSKLGADGWCTSDTDCKCQSLGATCNGVFCTFTLPSQAPDAGSFGGSTGAGGVAGTAGSPGTGGSKASVGGSDGGSAPGTSSSGGNGCSVCSPASPSLTALVVALGVLVGVFLRRRRA